MVISLSAMVSIKSSNQGSASRDNPMMHSLSPKKVRPKAARWFIRRKRRLTFQSPSLTKLSLC